MSLLEDLESAYREAKDDPAFKRELGSYLREYIGRPTPLYYAERLTEGLGGAKIYLKREDLAHTGAHKINNTMGQILLARRMGKKRIIAETGAGQHGVATAAVASMFGLECEIYMGTEDMERQALNVFRMRLLGSKVTGVDSGSKTLKDAINEAIRDWVTNVETTFYIFGSVLGPHPYPMIVRDFQRVIGVETRAQILKAEGRLPDCLVACVGGGSNAIGLFHAFLDDPEVKMIGVEAGGHGIATGEHAGAVSGWRRGGPSWGAHLSLAGQERSDRPDPLGLSRAGLLGRRSRALLSQRRGSDRLYLRDRPGSARGIRETQPVGGYSPRA